MKDHRHQDTFPGSIAIAVPRPNLTQHYHYVPRPKWSAAAQDGKPRLDKSPGRKYSWPFSSFGQPALASVSTDRQLLVGASNTSTTTTSSTDSGTSSWEEDAEEENTETSTLLPFTEKYGRCLEIIHYGSNSTTRLHEEKISQDKPEYGSGLGLPSKRQFVAVKVYRFDILDDPGLSSHHHNHHQNGTRQSSSPSRSRWYHYYSNHRCTPKHLSTLHPTHPNILQIKEILHNERSELCLVTPFCGGGDLHELLSRNGPLPRGETDCIIAQILRALRFLHERNTAHRDIRLETVLLTSSGAVKVAGFGDGHVRRLWGASRKLADADADARAREYEEDEPETSRLPVEDGEVDEETDHHQTQSHSHSHSHSIWSFPLLSISVPWHLLSPSNNLNLLTPFKTHQNTHSHPPSNKESIPASFPGISLPYIPPEGLRYKIHTSTSSNYERSPGSERAPGPDPRPADIWSVAIIYLALIYGRLPWRCTRPGREDARYLEYLRARGEEDGFAPVEALGWRRRNAIYAMLNPSPRKRVTAAEILDGEWMDGVSVCEAGEVGC